MKRLFLLILLSLTSIHSYALAASCNDDGEVFLKGIITKGTPLIEGGEIYCVFNEYPTSEGWEYREVGVVNGLRYSIEYHRGIGVIQGVDEAEVDKESAKYADIFESNVELFQELHGEKSWKLNRKNWNLNCETDLMTDLTACGVFKEGIGVVIAQSGDVSLVSSAAKDFRSKVMIRVGDFTPYSSESYFFNPLVSKAAVKEMLEAESMVVRLQSLSGNKKDELIDLYGFTEAWEVLNAVHKRVAAEK